MIVLRVLRFVVLLPVFAYQLSLSRLPGVGSSCRHEPTCSNFMVEAVRRRGVLWGGLLGGFRVLRCNPFMRGGYDPVDDWPPYDDPKTGRLTWHRPHHDDPTSGDDTEPHP